MKKVVGLLDKGTVEFFVAVGGAWAIILIYFLLKFVSSAIKDYEVIEPVEGQQCIVVSRFFNTSVDCWQKEGPK